MKFENDGYIGAARYTLDNPWWKQHNVDPSKINRGKPIFLETWVQMPVEKKDGVRIGPPTFTVYERDRLYSSPHLNGGKETLYPSFIRVFVEHMDPSEYIFAMSVFDSWSKWENICHLAGVQDIIEEARKQLGLRLRAISIRKQIELTESMHQKASEFVIKEGWNEHPSRRAVGRPKKSTDPTFQDEGDVAKDLERIKASNVITLKRNGQ